MGILTNIGNGVKQSLQSIKEIKEAKRIEKKRLCKVVYIDDNGLIEDYEGKLSSNSDYLIIENLDRLFMVDKIYHNRKFMPTVFVSSKFHKTLNTNELFEYVPEFEDKKLGAILKLSNTLNMQRLDNQKSFNFSIDSSTIMRSKAFEFLEDVAKRTIYIAMLIGFLLGAFVGAVMMGWILAR